MRNSITIILLMLLLSSCGANESNTVYVWNMKDVIGLWLLAIIILFIAGLFLWAWIQDMRIKYKRNKKRRQQP